VTSFTELPDACEVRHQRALEIEEILLNDFFRFSQAICGSNENFKFCYVFEIVGFCKRCTTSVCPQSDGCGRKDPYGLIPSTALFYRLKEIRA